jgi:hypothetical protein
MSKSEASELFSTELAQAAPAFQQWLADRLREKAEREERERQEKERLRLEKERQERERLERERQIRVQQQEIERLRLEQLRVAQQRAQELANIARANNEERASAASNSAANKASTASAPAVPLTPQSKFSGSNIDINEFRNGLQNVPDAKLDVARSEIVSVRVVRPPGSEPIRVVWQFATLNYDIGFGVDFEREDGTVVPILPVMRMNSHQQVIEGRLDDQRDGAWLLKFDNSFSYFRSKTVLYRVIFQAV